MRGFLHRGGRVKQQKIIDELIASQQFGKHISLQPIQGGTVNRSYQLVAQEHRYFLKTFELNHIAPTDRQALFLHQQQLADFHKAARPLYLSKGHDFQVETWTVHTSLKTAQIEYDEKIKALAQTLNEVHQLPTMAVSIDLPKDWLLYLDIAGLGDDKDWLDRIARCKPDWIDTHKVDQVLCHNDLAMEHVAVGKPSLVFDWEYAALGNRFFDIASCALINKLDAHHTLYLQQQYAHISGLEESYVFEQCQKQFPIVTLTNDLWYLAASTVGKDPV